MRANNAHHIQFRAIQLFSGVTFQEGCLCINVFQAAYSVRTNTHTQRENDKLQKSIKWINRVEHAVTDREPNPCDNYRRALRKYHRGRERERWRRNTKQREHKSKMKQWEEGFHRCWLQRFHGQRVLGPPRVRLSSSWFLILLAEMPLQSFLCLPTPHSLSAHCSALWPHIVCFFKCFSFYVFCRRGLVYARHCRVCMRVNGPYLRGGRSGHIYVCRSTRAESRTKH